MRAIAHKAPVFAGRPFFPKKNLIPDMSKKNPFEIMGASNAHRNLVREMGPECRCAVRNATACERRVGCTTECCSAPQAATLKTGVGHVMEKAEAHGGPLRCTAGTGRRRGALRLWVVSHA